MEFKKTALYNKHLALGGKMVNFAGFIMPVQYSGIIEEHLTVRRQVGVFDVSHMGEFIFRGPDAETFLNRMTTNNVSKLEVGDIQYSAMLYDSGGVVDDLLVYRFTDYYMTVVNAANLDKDYNWLYSHLEGDVQMKNVSDEISLLAIQGPRAVELVNQLTDKPVDDIEYYHFREGSAAGVETIISRTGYTGEIGYELFVRIPDSDTLWDAVFAAGKPLGLKPIGLGARDSLRLEVAYCLYGNDIDQTTNPLEAGLGWIFKGKKKGGFIGLEAASQARDKGLTRRLVGFNLEGKGIARHGAEVFNTGQKVGHVTSGGYSPMLDKVIGLAYVDKPYDVVGGSIQIDVRGKLIPAVIVEIPFYRRPD